MIQPILYLRTQTWDDDNNPTDVWTKLDMDEKVNVRIKDSIKNAKDVGKIFTAFTNPFKLPASKTNNKAFKHFSNFDVKNGFDPRRKHSCLIQFNGTDFKKGYLKLENVDLKDNRPEWYNVQFFGELVTLKDILGTALLKDLSSLNKFNHDYSPETLRAGFEQGLGFDFSSPTSPVISADNNGDIKYPFISHTRGFEYDDEFVADGLHRLLTQEERDANYTLVSDDYLAYTDLKPALRVTRVFEAITETFPQIEFDQTWLNSSTINDLYMWLHRTKGSISYQNGEDDDLERNIWEGELPLLVSAEYPDIYYFTSGDHPDNGGDMRDFFTQRQGGFTTRYFGKFIVNYIGTGTINLEVRVYKNGQLRNTYFHEHIDNESGGGGTHCSFEMYTPNGDGWTVKTKIIADSSFDLLEPEIFMVQESRTSQGN